MRAHETEFLGVLYDCDPCKNVKCKKTNCKLMFNGECCMTTEKEFAKDGCENSPHIFRKPIPVIRIVGPTGKPMADFEKLDENNKDESTVTGILLNKFKKLYSREYVEELIEKQFKIMLYSATEYNFEKDSDMYVTFSLDMSAPREVTFELDELYNKTKVKLTSKKQ